MAGKPKPEKITKQSAARVLKRFRDIQFEPLDSGGRVTVGGESKEWKWTAKGDVQPRSGTMKWLRAHSAEFGKAYPEAGLAKGAGRGGRRARVITKLEQLAGYSRENLATLAELVTQAGERLEKIEEIDRVIAGMKALGVEDLAGIEAKRRDLDLVPSATAETSPTKGAPRSKPA